MQKFAVSDTEDFYGQATSVEGLKRTLQTDYILKVFIFFSRTYYKQQNLLFRVKDSKQRLHQLTWDDCRHVKI